MRSTSGLRSKRSPIGVRVSTLSSSSLGPARQGRTCPVQCTSRCLLSKKLRPSFQLVPPLLLLAVRTPTTMVFNKALQIIPWVLFSAASSCNCCCAVPQGLLVVR